MARIETDREDLMREASALRRRAELVVPGEAEHLVAGLRDDGTLALYFGADPVYQFDPRGRLRRAFVDGDLYRTQGATLARLTRVRTSAATELRRHDLGPEELERFLDAVHRRLERLRDALERGTVRSLAQVPAEGDLLRDLLHHVSSVVECRGALAPPIRGKT